MVPIVSQPVPGLVQPVQYKSVGTNIDCFARGTDDGRFKIGISLEDTSVYSDGQSAQGAPRANDMPSFRNLTLNNTVILKDGQSTQFVVATDKVSGETMKVDVTVTVVK